MSANQTLGVSYAAAPQAAYTLRHRLPRLSNVPAQAARALPQSASGYVEGTLIMTDQGERPIELVRAGTLVRVSTGRLARVTWVGIQRIDIADGSAPLALSPVEIAASALSDGVPRRTLRLASELCLFIGGDLVPVRTLVNNVSIRHRPGGSVTYWHLELTAHAALVAEGASVESYCDVGNRGIFDNASTADAWARRDAIFAPFVDCGDTLESLRARLTRRGRRLDAEEPLFQTK